MKIKDSTFPAARPNIRAIFSYVVSFFLERPNLFSPIMFFLRASKLGSDITSIWEIGALRPKIVELYPVCYFMLTPL